jgi:uncharacterized membrane protein
MDNLSKIKQLSEKLNNLLIRQKYFEKDILQLQKAIEELELNEKSNIIFQEKTVQTIVEAPKITETDNNFKENELSKSVDLKEKASKITSTFSLPKFEVKSDLEKFIGENLINKIGIIITIIGVSIGAKYSIEHELISPLTRIILGYFSGFILLGFGLKFKKKYTNFSAVLVSGAMAIMYFITFFAYDFYAFIPLSLTFLLMVIFTIFTVYAALNYDKQVIAHIGLVGAYAVPFLLSNNSGRVDILFSYMTIINIGILVIAYKKYWKPLYYVAFSVTWLIFLSWYGTDYKVDSHFALALLFSSLFFFIFYATILSYKLIKKEIFNKGDIILILINSFIYYGVVYTILDAHEIGNKFLGLFTLFNALIHFGVSYMLHKKKVKDRNLFYLSTGLVLLFITLAIPVQLDGNWVTIFWAGEAAILFWIGRTKNKSFYELMSYPVMIIASISIIHDWETLYANYYTTIDHQITPLLNVNFLSSLLFINSFAFINIVNRNKSYSIDTISKTTFYHLMKYLMPVILIGSIYFAFIVEINSYYSQLFNGTAIKNTGSYNKTFNYDLSYFNGVWKINFTLFFIAVLTYLNDKKLKNKLLNHFLFGFIILTVLAFLTVGLYHLSELRESYLTNTEIDYKVSSYHIWFRYISIGFVALTLYSGYKYLYKKVLENDLKILFNLLSHIAVLWITSSELIHWLDISGHGQNYKLGLSILWGIYSVILIIAGIWKNKKHLRIGAFILFGVTLIKLFFYDIVHLNTISKTIVLIALGVLLLFISFLYNKYKTKIFESNEDNTNEFD